MATIARMTNSKFDVAAKYLVAWTDNDGIGKERYFNSYGAAEKFASEIEMELFAELGDCQPAKDARHALVSR